MKTHISSLRRLAIVSLAAFPALAFAVPPAGTAYYTDVTNSYVQDQTSQVMGKLNDILCFMGAMAPDLMVNSGDANGNYIALVDKNTCEAKGSGGQSGNTGAAYVTAVVNSTRASSTADMLVKAWLAMPQQDGSIQKIKVYATASQAPSATLPYGVFRMDFCGDVTNCAMDKGYINATTNGLSFFSSGTYGTDSETTRLQLNASSSSAGSGATSQVYSYNNNTNNGTSNFVFAYNTGYFVRNDGTAAGDLCFDRSPANADESVWRYGLYDATGARVSRNSGFPIEYTDSATNTTANAYISYYGLSTQGAGPASGSTVNKVTYSNSGATRTPYTLLRTGGKLMKYTTATKTLHDLHKVTFWYYAQNAVGAGPVMAANAQYELYWDDSFRQFFVSGKQNVGSNNMEPYTTPVAVANLDMKNANPWGLWGWSQMMGGQFGIQGSDFANLTSATPATVSAIPVKVQTQDIVYPTDYATVLPNGLKCINDCPTKALIDTSNASSTTPFENQGWTQLASTYFKNYTLNATSGNLVDAASADVVSAAVTGMNSNGVRSGRMVTPADAALIVSRKNALCGTCNLFSQGDVDLLDLGSSYYVWETGGQSWNQIAILMNGSTPVVFEPPLQVSFVVPANIANNKPYGSYAGATISLQYGGFGDLWGIPNECIDVTTNAECVFSGLTPTTQNNQRWTSEFSIPFDTTKGIVTTGATTYYAKALDKEVRLAKVDCATAGLSTASLPAATLPDATGWIDPAGTVGTKPTVTAAPQVIHGVKQY